MRVRSSPCPPLSRGSGRQRAALSAPTGGRRASWLWFAWLSLLFLRRRGRGGSPAAGRRDFSIGRVALEGAGENKLTKLVAHHVLGNVDGNMLFAVMHRNGQADEIRQDGGAARPGLDRALVATAAHFLDFAQ